MIRIAPVPVCLAAVLLVGCVPTDVPEDVEAPSADLLEMGLSTASPEPWVGLVEDPAATLWAPDLLDGALSEPSCPAYSVVEDEEGVRELWTGNCRRPDGTAMRGRLERFEDDDITWLAGHGFNLYRDGTRVFSLDGAIEIDGQGELMLLDVAANTCGLAPELSCEDDLVVVDLSWTVFPAAGYPEAYDATVSGVLGAGDAPVALEGTWSIDEQACATEPASGTIALEQGERHAIELDGAEVCDGCAAWVVQGEDVPAYCGVSL